MNQSEIIELLSKFVWKILEEETPDTPITEASLFVEFLKWAIDNEVTFIKLNGTEGENGRERG